MGSEQVEAAEDRPERRANGRADQSALEPGIAAIALAVDPGAEIAAGKESTRATDDGAEHPPADRPIPWRTTALREPRRRPVKHTNTACRGDVQRHRRLPRDGQQLDRSVRSCRS